MSAVGRKDRVSTALVELIEACEHGERGYRDAAERDAGPLSSVFLGYSRQRARFAEELREMADRFGVDAGRPVNPRAAARQSGGAPAEVLVSERERGERDAMRTYERALDADLPENVRRVVELQFRDLKEAYLRMRTLDEQRRNADVEPPGTETEGSPD